MLLTGFRSKSRIKVDHQSHRGIILWAQKIGGMERAASQLISHLTIRFQKKFFFTAENIYFFGRKIRKIR